MELDRLRQNIAKHIALSEREFLHFASFVQRRRLQRRDRLLTPGEICRFEGFVHAGCLRVYCTDPGGSDHILYFAPEDWWFADIQSFVSESPADLGIDALEPTDALLIDKASKERLYVEVPKFERLFRIMTQRALVALERRMIGAMAKSAEERYFDFKQRYPTLEERIPQYHIAAYLGIRPECLSRMRRHISTRES